MDASELDRGHVCLCPALHTPVCLRSCSISRPAYMWWPSCQGGIVSIKHVAAARSRARAARGGRGRRISRLLYIPLDRARLLENTGFRRGLATRRADRSSNTQPATAAGTGARVSSRVRGFLAFLPATHACARGRAGGFHVHARHSIVLLVYVKKTLLLVQSHSVRRRRPNDCIYSLMIIMLKLYNVEVADSEKKNSSGI